MPLHVAISFESFDTITLAKTNDIATSNSIVGPDIEILADKNLYKYQQNISLLS